MVQGIVLAGGYSSRTQINKMHLIVDEKPILIHTIESIKPFVSKVVVVTGKHDQDIRTFVKEDEKVTIVYNPNYDKGMFSSVLTGIRNTQGDVFIIPGDIPFIKKETFEALLKGTKDVRYPTYQGKEGHPLFIKDKLREELLKESIDSNLRLFRDKQDKEMIEVDDPNILKDIDTMDEYKTLLNERR